MTAGIPFVLARTAVCELIVPYIVTNPSTFALSNWSASLGYISLAAMTNGSSVSIRSFQLRDKMRITRIATSLTSSSFPWIGLFCWWLLIRINCSTDVWTIYSALSFSSRILFIIWSVYSWSSRSSFCISKIAAFASPTSRTERS